MFPNSVTIKIFSKYEFRFFFYTLITFGNKWHYTVQNNLKNFQENQENVVDNGKKSSQRVDKIKI